MEHPFETYATKDAQQLRFHNPEMYVIEHHCHVWATANGEI